MGVERTDSRSSANAAPSRIVRGVAGRNMLSARSGQFARGRQADSQRRLDAVGEVEALDDALSLISSWFDTMSCESEVMVRRRLLLT